MLERSRDDGLPVREVHVEQLRPELQAAPREAQRRVVACARDRDRLIAFRQDGRQFDGRSAREQQAGFGWELDLVLQPVGRQPKTIRGGQIDLVFEFGELHRAQGRAALVIGCGDQHSLQPGPQGIRWDRAHLDLCIGREREVFGGQAVQAGLCATGDQGELLSIQWFELDLRAVASLHQAGEHRSGRAGGEGFVGVGWDGDMDDRFQVGGSERQGEFGCFELDAAENGQGLVGSGFRDDGKRGFQGFLQQGGGHGWGSL